MMSFNKFVHKLNLKNKTTSSLKRNEILKKIRLHSKVGISLRDGPFSSEIEIVKLHHSKKTHSVCYINENCFDNYSVVCPKKLSNFIIKRNGYCL